MMSQLAAASGLNISILMQMPFLPNFDSLEVLWHLRLQEVLTILLRFLWYLLTLISRINPALRVYSVTCSWFSGSIASITISLRVISLRFLPPEFSGTCHNRFSWLDLLWIGHKHLNTLMWFECSFWSIMYSPILKSLKSFFHDVSSCNLYFSQE